LITDCRKGTRIARIFRIEEKGHGFSGFLRLQKRELITGSSEKRAKNRVIDAELLV
jgi:hypothetical protein